MWILYLQVNKIRKKTSCTWKTCTLSESLCTVFRALVGLNTAYSTTTSTCTNFNNINNLHIQIYTREDTNRTPATPNDLRFNICRHHLRSHMTQSIATSSFQQVQSLGSSLKMKQNIPHLGFLIRLHTDTTGFMSGPPPSSKNKWKEGASFPITGDSHTFPLLLLPFLTLLESEIRCLKHRSQIFKKSPDYVANLRSATSALTIEIVHSWHWRVGRSWCLSLSVSTAVCCYCNWNGKIMENDVSWYDWCISIDIWYLVRMWFS